MKGFGERLVRASGLLFALAPSALSGKLRHGEAGPESCVPDSGRKA